ncbi:MAG: hypothetical protein ACFBZ9_15200 [Sphingomonadales bacterium]
MSEADPDMMQAVEAGKERVAGDEIDGVGKQYFDNVVIDNLMDAFLELSAEVWTIKDRNIVLETVLSDLLKAQGKDSDINALIEAYEPSDEIKALRKGERSKFIASVFASFSRRPV